MSKLPKRRTHDEYVEEVLIKNPKVEVIGTFSGMRIPIPHRCKIHDYIWNCSPERILKGVGCKFCFKSIISHKLTKTDEEYKREVALINPNIEVIEEYTNANKNILHRCRIDGYEWMARPNNILHGTGCPMCANKPNDPDLHYKKRLSEINPNIVAIGKYTTCKDRLLHKCLVCGNEWETTPDNILCGKGCPACKSKKCSERMTKTNEQYIAELYNMNPDIEPLEKYKGANTPIKHRCKIDNYEWMVTPASLLSSTGCPVCSFSKGELLVKRWLERHNIIYTPQKKFAECADKKPLPFDFYLPEYNICIEYDGEQHFRMVTFGCSDLELCNKNFETTKAHDKIKNKYCEDNGIRLIRISYNENVEEKLDLLLA